MGLFIDGFAGGGGASTGIAQAIGREVDIAVNHNPIAIAIHAANHPGTEHHCQDIRALWPRIATKGQPVAGAWFSPDCKEFSKAKGGPVKDRSIRALCWEVVWWLDETRPEVAYLENVEEFEYAAPLDGNGVPIPDKKGREFKRFVRKIRALGYRVAWKILRACDYGTPTSRKRLYMVMRRDGAKIVWPKATHAPANDNRVLKGKLLPYRTAAECIDWSIRCPSIFERAKELVDATKRRIAHGVMRYVVNAAMNGQRPFIVPVTHAGDLRTHDSLDPLRTITTANGGELAAVDIGLAPHLMTNRNSQKPFNGADEPTHTITAGGAHLNMVGAAIAPLIDRQFTQSTPRPANDPIGATTAGGGGKSAQVSAFLTRYYGSDKANAGGDLDGQLATVRAGGGRGGIHHAIVAAHIEQANTGMIGHTPRRPLSTIVGKGSTQRVVETTLVEEGTLPADMMDRAVKVAAFLVKYYGTDGESETSQVQGLSRPLDAITTKARFAVVTVTIDAVTYVIVDIGLRMLKPRELARAQGFPENYVLDPIVQKVVRGKLIERRLTIAEQISAIGNSVCPPVARALVAANQPALGEMRLAA